MSGGKLDRGNSAPLYQQLAALLREDIEEGRLPAGVAFPSERKLMARHGVTRTTVRSAIGVLRQEGLVTAEHQAGSFVRNPRTDRERVDGRSLGIPGRGANPDERQFNLHSLFGGPYGHEPVPRWIAELLGVDEGEEVLVQQNAGVYPTRLPGISRSWLHPHLERRLKVSPEELGHIWMMSLLVSHGIAATDGEDVVEAWMPTRSVKERLELPDGVPVLNVFRVLREKEEVVAVIEISMRADQAALVYPRAGDPIGAAAPGASRPE